MIERGQTVPADDDWEAAEARLSARAQTRATRRRRSARRRRWLPWLLGLVLAPLLGAAAFVLALRHAGGDLRDWSPGAATALGAGCVVAPAALAALAGRRCGFARWEAALLAVAAVAAVLALGLAGALAFVA